MLETKWHEMSDNLDHYKRFLFDQSTTINPQAIKLLPGVDFILHDYDIAHYRANINFPNKILRLDFAYAGNVHAVNNHREAVFLEPGFLKISQEADEQRNYNIIDGHYRGVTFLVNPEKVDEELFRLVGNPDVCQQIFQNQLTNQNFRLMKTEFIDRLFKDIAEVETHNQRQFLRLKVAELLLYLTTYQSTFPQQYFATKDIKKINAIHDFLLQNLDKRIAIVQLSNQFHISQTRLQKLFKSTYQQTIHQFVSEKRFDKACDQLKNSNAKILSIATGIGYGNVSKFSANFKKKTQMTPKQYRQLYNIN